MLQQSDSPINSTSDVIPNLGTNPYVEVQFSYTDVNTMWMSPIILRGSLGEKISMGVISSPLLDVDGNSLVDPCWMLMAGRLVPDF